MKKHLTGNFLEISTRGTLLIIVLSENSDNLYSRIVKIRNRIQELVGDVSIWHSLDKHNYYYPSLFKVLYIFFYPIRLKQHFTCSMQ